MKYIRTKDGRIIESHRAVIKELTKDKINFVQAEVICGETIKEANTIEELCEVYIATANNGIGYGSPNIINKEDTRKFLHSYGGWSIYAAIWVFDSNGAPILKPVAKLNEKGEFELL